MLGGSNNFLGLGIGNWTEFIHNSLCKNLWYFGNDCGTIAWSSLILFSSIINWIWFWKKEKKNTCEFWDAIWASYTSSPSPIWSVAHLRRRAGIRTQRLHSRCFLIVNCNTRKYKTPNPSLNLFKLLPLLGFQFSSYSCFPSILAALDNQFLDIYMSTSGENLDLNLSLNLPLSRMHLASQPQPPVAHRGYVRQNPFAFLAPPSDSAYTCNPTHDKFFTTNYNNDINTQLSLDHLPHSRSVAPQNLAVSAILNHPCWILWIMAVSDSTNFCVANVLNEVHRVVLGFLIISDLMEGWKFCPFSSGRCLKLCQSWTR